MNEDEIYEIRRLNLKWLADVVYDRKEVATRLGYEDVNYLNQLISVKAVTRLGNSNTRKIEKKFLEISLEPRWMDRQQWPDEEDSNRCLRESCLERLKTAPAQELRAIEGFFQGYDAGLVTLEDDPE